MSLKTTTLTAAICLIASLIIQMSMFQFHYASENPRLYAYLASTLLIHLPLILFFFALFRKQ